MRILYIISEGRTESDFVKNVLAEHLYKFDWYNIIPITLPTGKNKTGVHKGGFRSSHGYRHAVQEIARVINTKKNGVFTTFFDYYGFPADIPCHKEAEAVSSPYEKVKLYENQIKRDVFELIKREGNNCPFMPYVQPHEFEALLFADTDSSADILANGDAVLEKELKKELSRILSEFETPEYIDHGFDTAPSKRIESLLPGFVKNKAGMAGFSWRAVQKAGIPVVRQRCLHFNEWLDSLEKYK